MKTEDEKNQVLFLRQEECSYKRIWKKINFSKDCEWNLSIKKLRKANEKRIEAEIKFGL